ncbi:helix-turn-helix transcriptional regulator [Enterococcus sp. LJL128]|uniref:helix-turn-helix transcriptional regulator n=1 Tax=Enterococcus sp. LJL51 TaxID=3416656 RepID=UPI003CF2F6C6
MMISIFIYNILLIVLYALAMSLSISFYMKEKKKIYMVLTIFLLFFIFDNVIIYMTEFINSFASSYNQTFMSIPAAKTIIYLANAYCSFLIITTLLNEKLKMIHYLLLIMMAVWLLSVPLLPNSAFKIWLYYLPNQLLMIYMGLFAWMKWRRHSAELSTNSAYYLKWAALASLIGGILILLEDTYVIFNLDQYTSLSIKINNRNVCEDIFSILICVLMMKFFLHDSQKPVAVEEPEQNNEAVLFENFCCHYALTQREKEIFTLLLAHKQNQEIADEIFLSIGTVKTHVHNIFIKLNIKKRNQIFSLYEAFTADQSNTLSPLNQQQKHPSF